MDGEHELHGENVGETIPDDQPVDPALLLPLDHLDHPQVDGGGRDQHGYVGQKVDHGDLIDFFRRVNTEGKVRQSKIDI